MAWLKKHWSQALVFVLSVLVALGLHFGKLTTDQAIAIGSGLGFVGIHLPGVVYKVRPPVVGAMLALFGAALVVTFGAALAMMVGCGAPKVAKTEYGAQLQACIDVAHNRAEADACIASIRLKWDEAGAPPALVLDGGAP